MNKNKINIRLLTLVIAINLMVSNAFSQNIFTKELKWEFNDSTLRSFDKTNYKDTSQIINWYKMVGYSYVETKAITFHNKYFFIVTVDRCSSYCPKIYIFEFKNEYWHLKMKTTAQLNRRLIIDVKDEKIIFRTTKEILSELPL